MQTIDGPLSCSECGFLCSTCDDTGTFVDRLTAGRRSPGGNYNRTYHYIRKAYPLWQQLYHQLSLDRNVVLRSQCDNSFNDVHLEDYSRKEFIDAPRLLDKTYNFRQNCDSEGWLYGQELRSRSSEPELPRLVENSAVVPYSVLHGAINEISPATGASSRAPVSTTTTHLVFSVTKENVKAAKKEKLFKSVLWFAVGVKRSTNKKKANLKTRKYKVRREIVYHGKLISSVTTFKKLRNRLDTTGKNKMENLRSWPTLSGGGAATTNFPGPFYQRSFPSPGSGCDWASVVKQRHFEPSAADHKSSSSSLKRADETSSVQLKASLVVTKTKRVPEKTSGRRPLFSKGDVRTEDKDGDCRSTNNGANDGFRSSSKQVPEHDDKISPDRSSATTTEAAAPADSGGFQQSGGTCRLQETSLVNSDSEKGRVLREAEMTLVKSICSPPATDTIICGVSGGDLSGNGRGEETVPRDDGERRDSTASCADEDSALKLCTESEDKVDDGQGFDVSIISVKQTAGVAVAGITATVRDNSLDTDAVIASASKILHLTAKNILNTKTELSIFSSESKNLAQNFRTQLLKVKSRKDPHGSSDMSWRREGKTLCEETVAGDRDEASKHGGGLAVSLGHKDDGDGNVVIICKISNKTPQGSDELSTEAAVAKSNFSGNGDLGANLEIPRLVDVEKSSTDGSGESRADVAEPVVLRDNADGQKRDVRGRGDDGDTAGKCKEDGAGKLDNDAESASSKSSVHVTSHKSQMKPLRSKMKYDAAATSFIPVTNWKRKPHASPSLSKYRWIAPPRKDSQLSSPRTSLSKFQQSKQAGGVAGNQSSADYRKMSKKVADAAGFRRTSVADSSSVFAGRGRGSLIKSATFTNSNLDAAAADRSYVMSDGMKVVFGPNAVNTPCSKVSGGKSKRDSAEACKEKAAGNVKDAAEEVRQAKPPSRPAVDSSYRKQQEPATKLFHQSLQQTYQKSNLWKNTGNVSLAVSRGGESERTPMARDQQTQPPPPPLPLYASQNNCCFGGEPRNGDVIYRLPIDHGLKSSKWQPPPPPHAVAYDENPDLVVENAFGLKVQEEAKVRYAAPPPQPLFGSESSSFNTFSMLQQGNSSPYSFCPGGVKLCQGNPSAFRDFGGDKLMDVAAWRGHQHQVLPPWADYSSGRFNKQQQQTTTVVPSAPTSDNCYSKMDNQHHHQQQYPAAVQPVFFIPRKDTRNLCGEIQNFCNGGGGGGGGNNGSSVYSYFSRGSHFVGAFGDQEKQ